MYKYKVIFGLDSIVGGEFLVNRKNYSGKKDMLHFSTRSPFSIKVPADVQLPIEGGNWLGELTFRRTAKGEARWMLDIRRKQAVPHDLHQVVIALCEGDFNTTYWEKWVGSNTLPTASNPLFILCGDQAYSISMSELFADDDSDEVLLGESTLARIRGYVD